jgi:uncharacterized protein involved in exopolysaccharide biosynthesis
MRPADDREPAAGQGAPPAEIDLLEIGRTLHDYRYWIAGITVAFALLAVVFALTATPRFRADAAVSEVSSAGAGGLSSLAGELGGIASLVGVNLAGLDSSNQFGMAVLRSRHLVEEFIRRNDLLPVLNNAQDAENSPTLWRTTDSFRRNILKINQDTRTGVIVVSISWTDPVAAADWANGLVALANEMIRERARQTAERNIKYLKKQIEQTPVLDMQRVMYNLVESETKTLMLANVREDFAFVVVDPAVPPEIRDSPKRTLIVIVGTLVGGFLGLMIAFAHSTVVKLRKRERNPA